MVPLPQIGHLSPSFTAALEYTGFTSLFFTLLLELLPDRCEEEEEEPERL